MVSCEGGWEHLAHHARVQWNPVESKEEADHQGGRPGCGGWVKTRPRAALLDEPASAGGGTKERRAAPLSFACPKTLLWRFTRASLRDRAANFHVNDMHAMILPKLDSNNAWL